ncbi:MAG: hypothetical protein ACLVL7_12775, partial [Anaerotruncus massiliensis (ex Togo et al. 2019)]
KRTYTLPAVDGVWLSVVQVALFGLLCAAPAFILFSEKGPGSMHAPIWISLIAGLVVGALAQRTRLCMVGGIRDVLLFQDWTLLSGFVAILVAALAGNLVLNAVFGGYFNLGFMGQPVAHIDGVWNFSWPRSGSARSCWAAAAPSAHPRGRTLRFRPASPAISSARCSLTI